MNRIFVVLLTAMLVISCAPRVSDQHYSDGVSFFEQGEYYKAMVEFRKYPPKHKLYNDAQDYIRQSAERLEEIVQEIMKEAESKWQEDFYSMAISKYYQVKAVNPEEPDIDGIIAGAEEELEKTIQELQANFEKARDENDIISCKQNIEKMIKVSPEHQSTVSTQETYQSLKDVVLQKSYLQVEDYLKTGRKSDVEKAGQQVEFMQNIDETDQRTIIISRKLEEYLEKERLKAERTRESQKEAKLQQYMSQGSAFYEQGSLKEAIEVWEKARREGVADNTLLQWLSKAKKELNELVFNYLKQGEFYFESEDYSKAKELFEQALGLDPKNATAKEYLDKINIIQQ